MSSGNKPNQIENFWKGYISGTNRGKIILSMEGSERTLNGKGILFDQKYGPSTFRLSGSIEGRSGKMNMDEFQGFFGVPPLDGEVNLTFTTDYKSAEGNWKSDIGTAGSLKIDSFSNSQFKWMRTWYWNKLQIFLSRNLKILYGLFYLIIIIISLSRAIEISFVLLILLFTPGLYIFRYEIRGLIEALGLKKIAGAEFQERKPTLAPAPTPYSSLSTEIDKFLYLDGFFVPKTKLLLLWFGDKNSVEVAQLINYALLIGIADNNISNTAEALENTNCIAFKDKKYKLSDFGKKYIKNITARL